MAGAGRDLLPRFKISTKVGFFPAVGRAKHSLEPDRLREAVEQSNRDLGRAPDLVFLHNPERSLTGSSATAQDRLGTACAAVERAAAKGLCGGWGISSWDPRPLPGLVDGTLPRPDAVMVRAGLLAGIEVLEASEALAARWDLNPAHLWGMSPFGGSPTDPLWDKLDPRVFIQDPHDGLSAVQATFRVAYSLPRVGSIAVGTDNPSHLRELIDALRYEANADNLSAYRRLLREQRDRQPL